MITATHPPLWIKDPLGIFADGAERGIVVQKGEIVELVAKGRQPATPAVPPAATAVNSPATGKTAATRKGKN